MATIGWIILGVILGVGVAFWYMFKVLYDFVSKR